MRTRMIRLLGILTVTGALAAGGATLASAAGSSATATQPSPTVPAAQPTSTVASGTGPTSSVSSRVPMRTPGGGPRPGHHCRGM
jgi:ABC-type transporter Mla subunit MlaD